MVRTADRTRAMPRICNVQGRRQHFFTKYAMGRLSPSRGEGEEPSAGMPGAAGGQAARPVGPPGDPIDFAEQFQASYRVLWLVAAGIIGDRSAAEDVVQEAAMHALGKLDQFEAGTNFRAWMAQMVRYVALNHLRRRQKHRAAPLTDAVPSSPKPEASAALELGGHGELPSDQMHFDDRVMAALNSVGDVARACLLLRTIEQMEYSDISKVLGIPEGTAMSHVHRTRQHLRERLAGFESLAGAHGETSRDTQGDVPGRGARKGARP